MKLLVVVDMQNDFIDGSLGTAQAEAIVMPVVERIKQFDGLVLATRDTHYEDYMNTMEGKNLPVSHCIKDTVGWQLHEQIAELISHPIIDKPTFGSVLLAEKIKSLNEQNAVESITLVGLCTDICVISNALLLKAYFPELPIIVEEKCCAGVSPETHEQALSAMKLCHIQVV